MVGQVELCVLCLHWKIMPMITPMMILLLCAKEALIFTKDILNFILELMMYGTKICLMII